MIFYLLIAALWIDIQIDDRSIQCRAIGTMHYAAEVGVVELNCTDRIFSDGFEENDNV